MFGLVSRRRYERDLAAAKADADWLRSRAEEAEGIARTEVIARREVVELNAQLDAANTRLVGRNKALQDRLDDACGLNHPAVQAGAAWQARRPDKPRPTTSKEASTS